MVIATFNVNKVTVCGHANSAPHGQDLVCAAISAVTQMLIRGVERVCEPEVTVGSGFVEVELLPVKGVELLVQALLDTLLSIEKEYPEFLKVITN